MRDAPVIAIALATLAGGAILVGSAFVLGLSAAEPDSVTRGAGLYARNCAQCHGTADAGGAAADRYPAPPLNAAGHAWRHSDAQLAQIVARGLRDPSGEIGAAVMPGFAGRFGRGEIRAVLAYVKSTWPSEIRNWQAAMAFEGEDTRLALLRDPASRLPGTCLPSVAAGPP